MVMGAPVSYPLGCSVYMFLGLVLCNSFGIREGNLVGVSLVPLDDFIIGTVEGSLVGLSLVLSLGYPLDSTNPVAELPGMLLFILLDISLGNPFGSLMLKRNVV